MVVFILLLGVSKVRSKRLNGWRGGGSLARVVFFGALPPTWDSIRSRMLDLGLRWSPIASGMEESLCVWLIYAEGK